MKSFMANPSNIERKWFVVDAADKTLGRMAAEVAKVLRGKHKPTFTPHMDTGDHVIVINADKVVLTGKKLTQKIYFRHSGYLGGDSYAPLTAYICPLRRFMSLPSPPSRSLSPRRERP